MKLKKFQYFYPEKPKLAIHGQMLFKKLSNDPLWVAEPKYNGSRLELHVLDGQAEFWGRHGKKLAYKPSKEIEEALKKFPQRGYYLFDGELRHNKTKGIRDRIILWDTIIHNGKLQNDRPYWARRSLLLDMPISLNSKEPISIITQYTKDFDKVFKQLIQFEEFEGLVIKNTQGMLNLGVNSCPESRWMFKVRKQTGRHRY
jgi:ATP-dependent DNA ligase